MTSISDAATELARCLYSKGTSPQDALNRQVLKLAEEAGEIVKAFNRWTGNHHRPGGFIGDLYAELADLCITAYITGAVCTQLVDPEFDLDAEIDCKTQVIFARDLHYRVIAD
jgi:NTP pyrophosphatase (non-canonical NTP hydrolase)